MQLLYTILYTLGFVFLSPLFLYKMWKRGKYRKNFWQRFGFYDNDLCQRLAQPGAGLAPAASGPAGTREQRCWIQAVSVGEVNVAMLLIRALRQKFPALRVILTTTTSTGYALACERLPQQIDLLYFPQDFPPCVRRAYDLIQPDFIVLIESELWPNHIWTGARRGVPLILVNGRMSPRSRRRRHRLGWLFRRVFDQLDLVCAQSQEDADSFAALGVPASRVHMTGNMKYDVSLPQADLPTLDPVQLLKQIGVSPAQPILVAGSTHPGEEEILLDLLAELRHRFPRLFLILVPRHVERTRDVVDLARRKQVGFVLRSEITPGFTPAAEPYDCLIVNTTGELKWFYTVATVIFVGKSLVGEGGQNIVEAAAAGRAVVFGPNMQNFRAIAQQFVAEGAGVQVRDAGELRRAVQELLENADQRQAIARAAQRVIQSNVGATQRCVELIAGALESE
jgi:3-deoxy-D-manno-octulosonic-acid transferase